MSTAVRAGAEDDTIAVREQARTRHGAIRNCRSLGTGSLTKMVIEFGLEHTSGHAEVPGRRQQGAKCNDRLLASLHRMGASRCRDV